MIKKILKLKGVGRFKSFSSTDDDLSMAKTTLIFGYNTYGKSTLTSVFRSLKDSNNHLIEGRKTFGTSGIQEIEILDSNHQKFIFDSKWSCVEIEIFDNDFISKNVFYGDSINKEQQSSLYEILIGEDVYHLKQKIDSAKLEKDKSEKNKHSVEIEFSRRDLGTFEAFLELQEVTNIDELIRKTQNELKQLINIDKLKDLISKTPLASPFKNFKVELSKILDLTIENEINEHINKHWKTTSGSKDFLGQGVMLLKDHGNCVFCGQDLANVTEFINNLRKVFSIEYDTLKRNIKRYGDMFIAINLEKEFLDFEKYGLNLYENLDYENLLSAKLSLDNKISAKQADLNLKLDLDLDPDFIIFQNELNKLSDIFTGINSAVSGNESRIISMNKEINKLEFIKYRFSSEGQQVFDKYKIAKADLDLRKEAIVRLNNELEMKVSEIFSSNLININAFLKKLGANFSLKELTPKSNMGFTSTHYCDFQFVIDDDHTVKISNKLRKDQEEPENLPHFKNTLSESDRRILAFSFYLAKMVNDPNLKSKILVLDDPFSSFDDNRKEETANILLNLQNAAGDSPGQKIILTHDRSFLCRLFDKLPNDSNVLKVSYSPLNGSSLQVCDVENDFLKDTYFKDLEYIKNSVELSTNVDEALKKARPCLEHLLKRKYYFLLSSRTLQTKSVGEYLTEIGDICNKKSEILSDNWHEDMHDEHQIMVLNEPGKIAKLKRFLELIREL